MINKGSVFHALQKYTDAITCYNIVLSIDKNNSIALVYKGLCIAEIGNIQLAIKYFKRALLIDAKCKLAKISINTNSISDSRVTNFYQFLALFILSEAFVNYKLRLEFIISINHYEILKREVLDILKTAYQLSEDEKYTEALKCYKNILKIEHDNIGIIIDYGVTLQNLEFYYQALEAYDTALTLQPKKH